MFAIDMNFGALSTNQFQVAIIMAIFTKVFDILIGVLFALDLNFNVCGNALN